MQNQMNINDFFILKPLFLQAVYDAVVETIPVIIAFQCRLKSCCSQKIIKPNHSLEFRSMLFHHCTNVPVLEKFPSFSKFYTGIIFSGYACLKEIRNCESNNQ